MSDKSYLIGSTNQVDDNPGFRVITYLVDNYTSQYLYLPNEQRFIPPKFIGVALHSTGEGRARAIWQAPGSMAQPAAVAGEAALVRVLDERLPISAGINFSATVPVKIPNLATFEQDSGLVAPALSAVILDSGPLAAGSFEIIARAAIVDVGGVATPATVDFQYRNAANAINKVPTPTRLIANTGGVVASSSWIWLARIDVLANERFRLVNASAANGWTNNIDCYLCVRPLG